MSANSLGDVLELLAVGGWIIKVHVAGLGDIRCWLRWQQGAMPDDGYREESTTVSTPDEAAGWLSVTAQAWDE